MYSLTQCLMKIVSVLNQKGGSGKTTIATNLARSLQRRGHRVLVADCDPQGTARDWELSADGEDVPTVTGQDRPNLEKTLPAFEDSFDVCVVDGAPAVQKMFVSAVKASDLVLIPVQPSPADVWAAEDIVEVVRARQEIAGRPEAAIVISRAITGTRLAESVEEVLERLELPVWDGTFQRVAYAEALGKGQGVVDMNNAKAADEINELTDKVEDKLSKL